MWNYRLQITVDLQRKAVQKLVNGEDVFVIQPTGSGKSLIFQSAAMVIDIVKETNFAPEFANARSKTNSLNQ